MSIVPLSFFTAIIALAACAGGSSPSVPPSMVLPPGCASALRAVTKPGPPVLSFRDMVKPMLPSALSGMKFHDGTPPLPGTSACLRCPLEGHVTVSARYRDPTHPFTPGEHAGIDFPVPVGTPVLAAADGIVTRVGPVLPDQDAHVYIAIGTDWRVAVHHLSRVDVIKDQAVKRGQQLGLSGGAVCAPGSGPWTTGPHLHFALWLDAASVDPTSYFCP